MTIVSASLVIGLAWPAYAGDSFVYSPETVQAELSGKARHTDAPFGFGEMLPWEIFANSWAGYSYTAPYDCELEYAKNAYDAVFYSPEDAVRDMSAAMDFVAAAKNTSAEAPDPELDEGNALVLKSWYVGMTEGKAGTSVDAYARGLIGSAALDRRLSDYITVDWADVGGISWLHYGFDYEDAIQAFYRAQFAGDGKNHPAYEETYHYRLDLYFRQIDDKIQVLYVLASGSYYGQSDRILRGLRNTGA